MIWQPIHKPEDDAKPVADALDLITQRLGLPRASTMSVIFTAWPEVTGEVGAMHAKPVSLKDGVLLVEVDNPVWRTELKWMSGQIADRLNERLGGNVVERLQLRVKT